MENRFASLKLQGEDGRLPMGRAEDGIASLLKTLITRRWQRLAPEYVDPLEMLYDDRARQWTAGWGPASSGAPQMQSCYILFWETESLKKDAHWVLLENGRQLYKGVDHARNPLAGDFKQLLENDRLPVVTADALFHPLFFPALPFPQRNRQYMAQALLNSLLSRPEIIGFFRKPLLFELERALPEGGEIQRIQFLESKNSLLAIMKKLLETGHLKDPSEKQRAHRILQFVRDDYFKTGYALNPVYQYAYNQAYEEFRTLLTDGNWCVRLSREAAATPVATGG